ncbi:MAG: TldD/PmbA family protein [Elusimicrobia bacterium]|nr:TldD/PmbA family protein [Elusimicrobiota bacterium]
MNHESAPRSKPGTSPLLDLACESLDWIRKRSGRVEAEVYLARGEERGIEMRNGALESIQSAGSEGVGLRVLDEGRMGFASAGGLDLRTIRGIFDKIAEQMPHLEPDDKAGFPPAPGPSAQRPKARDGELDSRQGAVPDGLGTGVAVRDRKFEASLWDGSLFSGSLEPWVEKLAEAQAKALSADRRVRSVLRIGYGESRGEVVIANTGGLRAAERGSSATLGINVLAAGEDGELQVGAAFEASRKKSGLGLDRIIKDGVWRATALLDACKLPGKRRAVVIDPWVAGELLDLVSELLCADSVQRGRSLLAGKEGSRVASQLVTLVDDPRRRGGAASSIYDDEGCATSAKTMVDEGVLKEFFYDTYTANMDGRPSNASASRGSYKGLPGPAPSNFYLAAGESARDEIISQTKDGLLVLEILGMHMTDPASGEISVGASGIAIERGRLTRAVKGCMISGNIIELMKRIDMVGSDLTFYGSLGSPTFRISHMTVA